MIIDNETNIFKLKKESGKYYAFLLVKINPFHPS